MTADPTLDYIQKELQEKYGCHTIILYGSRARSSGSPTSDYDVMGVRKEGSILRDARVWNGLYLDLFVYPEADIIEPAASLLYMRGGRVLREKDGLGARFLESLDQLYTAGPEKLRADEIAALKVWAEKSLLRIKSGGIEGNFRRAELLPAVLEHYFQIRGFGTADRRKACNICGRIGPIFTRHSTPRFNPARTFRRSSNWSRS